MFCYKHERNKITKRAEILLLKVRRSLSTPRFISINKHADVTSNKYLHGLIN